MAKILLVEDDPLHRKLAVWHLESDAHEVITADDGMQGLRRATSENPDLIVADHWMPNLDGISMLAALRANASTSAIPVIMLTGNNAAEAVERSQALGVSEYLAKPLDRATLLRAVALQVKLLSNPLKDPTGVPAGQERFHAATDELLAPPLPSIPTRLSIPVIAPGDSASGSIEPGTEPNRTVDGTVLIFGMQDFADVTAMLDENEHVTLVRMFYKNALSIVSQQQGWVAHFSGSGVIALFEDGAAAGPGHAERALNAAMLGVLDIYRFGPVIAEHLQRREMPPLLAGASAHSGRVVVCRQNGGRHREYTIIGDAVNVAARLQVKSRTLGWSVVCSEATLAAAGARFIAGRHGQLGVKGRHVPLDVVEVTGMRPGAAPADADDGLCAAINGAIRSNTALFGAAPAGAATEDASAEWRALLPHPADAPINIEGYRLVRKIGEGGVAQVFLADHAESGRRRVLKLVRVTDEDDGDVIQRFIQEYALLTQITHPNVARIYDQGFEGAHAFISMEYFSGGDLRAMMKNGVSPELAIAILIQVAGGLAAVHDAGVMHRDLKPDNIMIRADGSLAIADFGIAKSFSELFGNTQHGQVVGTPHYMAPEQALGGRADARSDIYSLGAMFYELLCGRHPYEATTVLGLMYQHVHAAIPQLPAQLQHFQPLVDGMMCKQAGDRISSAAAVIDNIFIQQLA